MKFRQIRLLVIQAIAALTLTAEMLPVQAERADRGKPVHLEADKVTVSDKQHSQLFEGDVRLSQGSLEIRAQRLQVNQDEAGFQRGTATGSADQQASFRQKREGRDEYVEGQADRIVHDGRDERTEFFGRARVRSGKDEVTGPYIQYDGKTEIYLVSGKAGEAPTNATATPAGRVRVVIQPKEGGAKPVE